MAYELVGYVNRQTFATFTPGKQNGVIEMSEYENQLQRMRDAFAASIVKSMTPEEINNTFQKLHDENQTLKLRAEKAERELDELAVAAAAFGLYVDDLRFLLNHHGDKIHRYSESHGWLKIKDCLKDIDAQHAKKCGR